MEIDSLECIVADFENGVLTLQLPKSEGVKPKRISIGENRGKKA